MTIIRGPFVKYQCGNCFRWIERQISAKRAAQELSDLCDDPQLYCAICEASRAERRADEEATYMPSTD